MRVVGTAAALEGTWVPGVGVLPPAGDLCASVGARVWSGLTTAVHVLVRVVSAAVRARRPAAVAQLISTRTRSVPLVAARAGEGARTPPPPVPTEPADGTAAPTASAGTDHRRELALPADPTAPRRARALLREAAEDWDLDDDLHQDVAMVVTELVANAVDHAHTTSTVTLALTGDDLHVTVRDNCPERMPLARPVDPTAARGRGLQMVDALAESWGVTVHADGKTVWAVLRAE